MSCDTMAERPPSILSHNHGNLGKRKRQSDSESSANISSAHSNSFRSRPPIAVPSSNYEIFNFHATHLPSPPFDPYTYDEMRFDTSAHSALDNTDLPLSIVDDLPQSKHRRRLHPCKLSRLTALAPANPNATQPSTTPNQSSNFAGSTKHPTPDLRPCRVCHKSPTRQRDLEGYKDCQQCEERACQICTWLVWAAAADNYVAVAVRRWGRKEMHGVWIVWASGGSTRTRD